MRLLPILAALSLYGCSVFGGSQLSCKVRDPDLAQGIYHGGCKDGWANGYGEVVVSRNGTAISSYRGDFVDGKKRGKGTKIMPNGDRYTGDFRDDYREGQGIYVWSANTPWAGDRYEGEYHHDLRDGWGVYQWASGDRYEGAWQSNLRMGLSVMEQRRVQAAEAVARSIKVGAMVCSEYRSNKDKFQGIRGTVESVKDNTVKVRIIAIEGSAAGTKEAALKKGGLLVDEVAHWQLCSPN
ncbi:MAG: hypothetical protein LJE57_00550 [Gallionella sp.]|nr:hypothetical protein [Gallionella sp.]